MKRSLARGTLLVMVIACYACLSIAAESQILAQEINTPNNEPSTSNHIKDENGATSQISGTLSNAAVATPPVKMVPGTVVIANDLDKALVRALAESSDALSSASYFAYTDEHTLGRWKFISVIGLVGLDETLDWNLERNGTWFALIVAEQNDFGVWDAAVEGTSRFSETIARVPNALLSSRAKEDLDPLAHTSRTINETYVFPWEQGKSMQYGSLGVHDNEFAVVSGWKAVDFLSDGNTGAGHAPNSLKAAAGGSISYKCTPRSGEVTTAIRINDLMYAHLNNSGSLYVGRSFNQREAIGSLKAGTFNEKCGYANQNATTFHVHWGFPNTGSLQVEGWTLSFSDGLWRRGGETLGKGSWLTAEGSGGSTCSNPNANQVTLYVRAGFDSNGECVTKNIGEYSNPGSIGLPDNSIRSIKVGANVRAKLCVDENFKGSCGWFQTDNGDLNGSAVGYGTSSVKVETRPAPTATPKPPTATPTSCSNPNANQVTLYVRTGFDSNGQCVTKNIGDYPNPGSIGLPNDSIRSIKVGANVRAQLCVDDNFKGSCGWFQTDNGDLNGSAVGYGTSSVKVEARPAPTATPKPPTATPTSCSNPNADQVTLYVRAGFDSNGQCVTKNIGDYPNPGSIGLPNDSIRSIKVGANVRAQLCVDDNFKGSCGWFQTDNGDLNGSAVGYGTSSVKVEAKPAATYPIQLYKDPNYGGDRYCYGGVAGNYPTIDGCEGFDEAISSLLLKSGWSVWVFEHKSFGGGKKCFTGNDSDLSNDQFDNGRTVDNSISSFALNNASNCPTWEAPPAPSLSAPSNGATIVEGEAINLIWNSSSGATEYYGEITGGPTPMTFAWQSGTSVNIGAQWPGYEYSWRVKARNSAGESGYSSSWTFKIVPKTPSNVLASPLSCNSVRVTWVDNSNSEEGYKIYRDNVEIGSVGANSASYTDDSAQPEKTYVYSVKAYLRSTLSYTEIAAARTPKCPAVLPPAPMPKSPSNGTTLVEGDSITLSWNSSTGAQDYYAEITGGPAGMGTGWRSDTSVNIGAQWPGYEYYWHVKARNSAGESEYSSSWTFKVVPKAPTNTSASAISCNSVEVTWADNSSSEDGYKIYRDGVEVGSVGKNGTRFTDNGVQSERSYTYTVKSHRNDYYSSAGNAAAVTTPKCPGPSPEYPVQFYLDANYGGNRYCYEEAAVLVPIINADGCRDYDDAISSVLLKSGYSLWVFENDDYRGGKKCYVGSDPDMSDDVYDNGRTVDNSISSYVLYNSSDCPTWDPDLKPVLLTPPNDATFVEGEAINLSWNSSASATYYFGEITGGPSRLTFGWQRDASYDLGSQWPGYEYSWRVLAWGGGLAYSDWWTFKVVPKAPTNVSASAISCNSVEVTWADNSSSEDGYKVYRDGVEVGSVGAGSTNYTDGVQAEKAYAYTVKAYTNGYYSSAGNAAAVTAPKCPVNLPPIPTLKNPASGKTFVEGDSITLSWNSSTGAQDYYVEITGGPSATASGWQSGTSYGLGSPASGYEYSWRVKARNSAGESGYSSARTFTVAPKAPTNVSASALSCTSVKVTWTDNSGSEDGYKIYRDGVEVGSVGAGSTNYTDGVQAEKAYAYTVKAYTNGYYSSAGNAAAVTTPKCPVNLPPIPTLKNPASGKTFVEGDSITLSWNSSTGAQDYYVEITGGPSAMASGWQSGTSYGLGSPASGYEYSWRVKARNSAGESGYSSARTFTVAPKAPTNVSASALSCTSVKVTWTDNSGSEDGYKIYRNGTEVGSVGTSSTRFIDNGVKSERSYTYIVRSHRKGYYSSAGNTATVTTPACSTRQVHRTFLPSVIAGPQYPLLNGNFEAGRGAGWNEYSSNGWYLIYEDAIDPPFGGRWVAWLGGDDNEISNLSQMVKIQPSQPYLRFYYVIHTDDACGYDDAWVLIDDDVVGWYPLCTETWTGSWQLATIDLSAYSGRTVTLTFGVQTDGSISSNWFIDDVSFAAARSADGGGGVRRPLAPDSANQSKSRP